MSGVPLPPLNLNSVTKPTAINDGIKEQSNIFNSGAFNVGSGSAKSGGATSSSLMRDMAFVLSGGLLVALVLKGF
jgi:hypothetical protein